MPTFRLQWHQPPTERIGNRSAGLCGLGYANVRIAHDDSIRLSIGGYARQSPRPFVSVEDAQFYAEAMILNDARRLVALIENPPRQHRRANAAGEA